MHASRFAAASEGSRQHWPLMRGGTNAVSLGGGTYLALMPNPNPDPNPNPNPDQVVTSP